MEELGRSLAALLLATYSANICLVKEEAHLPAPLSVVGFSPIAHFLRAFAGLFYQGAVALGSVTTVD
jgi:hypothetical protein